jgi:hypothetical protein
MASPNLSPSRPSAQAGKSEGKGKDFEVGTDRLY